MFDDLIKKLDPVLRKIRGVGKLTDRNMAESLREIRRVLLQSDVQYRVVKEFIERVEKQAVGADLVPNVAPGQLVVKIVHDELVSLLGSQNAPIHWGSVPPSVIMAVGLQGSGKTTFVGKLGYHLKRQGRNPLLVAADVQRPAAVEQLKTLGRSVSIEVFGDGQSSALDTVVQAIAVARSKHFDTAILDTAGRLHIDEPMMAELERIKAKVRPSEILYVADGMTGQDAVQSARAFLDRLDFDGIVLTKLDGDAKGGAALSIRSITGKPIKFISNGEKLDALEPFHPSRLASRILGMGDVVTLVEKATEAVDQEKAEKLARKIRKQTWDLKDFYEQLQQVKRMGSLKDMVGMLPGMGAKAGNLDVDDSEMVKIEAIINSMTEVERTKPHLINGSRRKRIALGSGTHVQDVNRLLRDFQSMQKMVKRMHGFGMKKFPKSGWPGGLPA